MSTVVPPYPQCHFSQFQSPTFKCGPKTLNRKFQKLVGFKLCAFPSSIMKARCRPAPPCPGRGSSLCLEPLLGFASSLGHCVISHHKKDEWRTMSYSERDRPHSHNFCYSISLYSISLVVIVNLLPCLIIN